MTTVRQAYQNIETTVPADLLLVRGACIVDDAMLLGQSTPLLKESIELWEADVRLDVDGTHQNAVLFRGTKVLQSNLGEPACAPDGGCLAVVLRTGFGTVKASSFAQCFST